MSLIDPKFSKITSQKISEVLHLNASLIFRKTQYFIQLSQHTTNVEQSTESLETRIFRPHQQQHCTQMKTT